MHDVNIGIVNATATDDRIIPSPMNKTHSTEFSVKPDTYSVHELVFFLSECYPGSSHHEDYTFNFVHRYFGKRLVVFFIATRRFD